MGKPSSSYNPVSVSSYHIYCGSVSMIQCPISVVVYYPMVVSCDTITAVDIIAKSILWFSEEVYTYAGIPLPQAPGKTPQHLTKVAAVDS